MPMRADVGHSPGAQSERLGSGWWGGRKSWRSDQCRVLGVGSGLRAVTTYCYHLVISIF